MIRHIVFWKFRPDTEAEQEKFLTGLQNLQGVIPELLKSEIVRDVNDGEYDAGLLAEFQDLAALNAYKNDPRHVEVSKLCKAIRTHRAALDYET